MEVYAAQIDRMDQGIGRILQAPRGRPAQMNNTLILFLADNGGCAEELGPKAGGLATFPRPLATAGPSASATIPDVMPGARDTYQSYGMAWANARNTPFRLYKHWVHEGGIATPLIASLARA